MPSLLSKPDNKEKEDGDAFYKPDGSHDKLDDQSAAEKAEADKLLESAASDDDKTSNDSFYSAGAGRIGGIQGRILNLLFKNRRRGGIATLIITVVSVVMLTVSSYWAGPGQLIQMMGMLKELNFGVFEESNEKLSRRMIRRLIYKDPLDSRLTAVERRMARSLEASLKAQGVVRQFDSANELVGVTDSTGRYIDLRTDAPIPGTNRTVDDAFRRRIVTDVGLNAYRAARGESKLTTVLYYIRYRPVMNRRYNIQWRFFENSQRRARDRVNDTTIAKKLRDLVDNGRSPVDPDIDASRNVDDDGVQTPESQNAESIVNEGDPLIQESIEQVQAEVESGSTTNEALESVKVADVEAPDSGSGGKKIPRARGAAALLVIGCMVQAYNAQAEQIVFSQRILPLIRLGNAGLTAFSQVMIGDPGALEDVGDFIKLYNNEFGDWTQAQAPLRAIGHTDGRGTPLPDHSRPGGNLFSQSLSNVAGVFDAIPFFTTVCNVASNTIVSGALTIASFLGNLTPLGLIANIGSEAAFYALNEFLPEIIKLAIGVTQASEDPMELTQQTDAGLNLSANEMQRLMGGRLLSSGESAQLDDWSKDRKDQQFAELPLADRLFSLEKSQSLMSKLAFVAPKSVGEAGRQLAMLPVKAIQAPLNVAFGAFGGEKTLAQSNFQFDNYGIDQYGFSVQELEESTFADPVEVVEWVDRNVTEQEKRAFDECFDTLINAVPDRCKSDNSTKFKYYRFYRSYTSLEQGMACLGAESSCTQAYNLDSPNFAFFDDAPLRSLASQ